ncbi:MAG: hypothetical protein TEF_12040 [Rhizobiales bacterium NRL2]|nr:MAG: hypothetical protein TEF_12040 [Rhizobiales bacterium NRL2]
MSNAEAPDDRNTRRSIPAFGAWLAISVLLALAVVAALAWLLLREPETVVRDGPLPSPQPPTAEMLAEVERLDALSFEAGKRLQEILGTVAAYDCPPGTAPADRARFEALKEKARAMLAAAGDPLPDRAAAPAAQAEPAVARAATAPTQGQAAPKSVAALSQSLEKAVVFVITFQNRKPVGTGTAFFIAPDLLVTNRHVIQEGDADQIIVTSESLGDVVRARVIARSPDGQPGDPDFALLRTERPAAPGVLPLSSAHSKLMDVIVAGYPGLALQTDAGFLKLAYGDRTSAPDMHQNRGEIRSTQELPGTTSIIHTADVLTGYSGGPLIDMCGRVVGVNTFIQVDRQQSGKFNSAQSTGDLVQFLNRSDVALPEQRTACKR